MHRLLLLLLLVPAAAMAAAPAKIVIAHRGASGYLPEHTLPAKAAAHVMGADYIEQDVVLTKDGEAVILHDHYLDRVTDVARVYPDRARTDGRWYAIDFTLAEINRLKVAEGFKTNGSTETAVYPRRFPLWKSRFHVHTLAEELELIQGLNQSRGREAGIYVEIKNPGLHRREGQDISRIVLEILKTYGYDSRSAKVYLQCFDPLELQRIKQELLPEMKMDLPLVQLIAMTDWAETMEEKDGKLTSYDYDWMLASGGMEKIAGYADGVGPWIPMIVDPDSTAAAPKVSNLVKDAHAAGLVVHPYTFRRDDGQIPAWAGTFEHLVDYLLYDVGVDGVFSDYPDLALEVVRKHK